MPLPDSDTFNIEFVQTVETYRCLYDVMLPEYSIKEEQDDAWNHIAQKFSATAGECKVRWKYLRGGLTRYIKKLKDAQAQGDRQIKQFYMWDAMQFVIPYVKSRPQIGKVPPSYLHNEDQEHFCLKFDPKDSENDNGDNNSCFNTLVEFPKMSYRPDTEPSSSSDKRIKRGIKEAPDDSPEREAYDVPAHKVGRFMEKSDNPDLDFFKSILPDLSEFNLSQKRRFKLRVLQLLEEMSSEGSCPGDISITK